MAYAARPTDFQRNLHPARGATGSKVAIRPSFWTKLLNAMFESRQRQAEREAGAYLARTGYRFTDSIERELNDRVFSGNWNPRR